MGLEEGGQTSEGQGSRAITMRPQTCQSKGKTAISLGVEAEIVAGLLGNQTGHRTHSWRQLLEMLTEQDLNKFKNKFWPS